MTENSALKDQVEHLLAENARLRRQVEQSEAEDHEDEELEPWNQGVAIPTAQRDISTEDSHVWQIKREPDE
jgi:hypothetical protein